MKRQLVRGLRRVPFQNGGISIRSTCFQVPTVHEMICFRIDVVSRNRLQPFSTISDGETKQSNQPKRSDRFKERKQRAKVLRERRKQIKVLQRERRQRETSQEDFELPELPTHDKKGFSDLFDSLASQYPLVPITKALQSLVKTCSRKYGNALLTLHNQLHDYNPLTAAPDRALLLYLLEKELTSQESPPHSSQVECMKAARTRALANNLAWCVKDAKVMSARSRSESLQTIRKAIHEQKSCIQLDHEATTLVAFLQDKLPSTMFKSVMKMFEDYSSSQKRVIRKLGANLENRCPHQYHLVAQAVADFFYMNEGLDFDVIREEQRCAKSRERWKVTKSEFIDSLVTVKEHLRSTMLFDARQIEKELKSREMNAAADNSAEVLQLSTTLVVPTDGRFRKLTHMRLRADVPNFDVTDTSSVPPVVFVDNLPIDMTEERMDELYSRCGPLNDIRIYNQRPDLDPGPLTMAATKRSKIAGLSANNFRKWRRPRTPVYAMLTFQDSDGQKKALDDPLRIFGMIVQRHAILSIHPNEMTRLFLEGVVEGISSKELHERITPSFEPEMTLVRNSNYNGKAMVGSCEVKFPSFERAYEWFARYSSSSDDFQVGWIRTPKDAEDWWTRKKGFYV